MAPPSVAMSQIVGRKQMAPTLYNKLECQREFYNYYYLPVTIKFSEVKTFCLFCTLCVTKGMPLHQRNLEYRAKSRIVWRFIWAEKWKHCSFPFDVCCLLESFVGFVEKWTLYLIENQKVEYWSTVYFCYFCPILYDNITAHI